MYNRLCIGLIGYIKIKLDYYITIITSLLYSTQPPSLINSLQHFRRVSVHYQHYQVVLFFKIRIDQFSCLLMSNKQQIPQYSSRSGSEIPRSRSPHSQSSLENMQISKKPQSRYSLIN
ncbi:hypothetical protein J4Q44_G00339600 [Coregonus suidteri]|uniref:Uncharacterized protein n=1 Tax=Coregonus suidteri TaxID=861788 RepID=A0AAN8KRW4_9TELE